MVSQYGGNSIGRITSAGAVTNFSGSGIDSPRSSLYPATDSAHYLNVSQPKSEMRWSGTDRPPSSRTNRRG